MRKQSVAVVVQNCAGCFCFRPHHVIFFVFFVLSFFSSATDLGAVRCYGHGVVVPPPPCSCLLEPHKFTKAMEEFAAVDSHDKQTTGSQVLLLFCSGKGGEDYLDLILLAFAVFLRGFEEVTYLYYRFERESSRGRGRGGGDRPFLREKQKKLLRLACLGRFLIVAAAVAEAPKMKHSSTGNFGGQEEERR